MMLELIHDAVEKVIPYAMEFVDVFGFNVLNATNPNNNINNGRIQVNMIHDLAKPCCILMQVVN